MSEDKVVMGPPMGGFADKIDSLEKMYGYTVNFAKQLFETQGSVNPMWVGQTEDGTLIPLCTEFENEGDKEEAAEAVKAIFKKYKVVRYVSMIEGWMITAEEWEEDGPSPTNHPNRREVLLIEGAEGPVAIFGYFHITRDEDGKGTLGKFIKNTSNDNRELDENGKPTGRFNNLLQNTQMVN